jgi:hypothetical protein
MSNDNTHNGWTNYATWRVNLEIFDGMSPEDICGETPTDVWQLETNMKLYVEDMIVDQAGDTLAYSYAMAFLVDVNWTELARHKIEEYA